MTPIGMLKYTDRHGRPAAIEASSPTSTPWEILVGRYDDIVREQHEDEVEDEY